MGRLREAALRLEKEATDALNVASAERAELESRLRHITMQEQGYAKQLQGEVERSELGRASQGQFMHSQFERLLREACGDVAPVGRRCPRRSAAADLLGDGSRRGACQRRKSNPEGKGFGSQTVSNEQ